MTSEHLPPTSATFAGGYFLKVTPLERALLTTGQVYALVRVGTEDSTIGFFVPPLRPGDETPARLAPHALPGRPPGA